MHQEGIASRFVMLGDGEFMVSNYLYMFGRKEATAVLDSDLEYFFVWSFYPVRGAQIT